MKNRYDPLIAQARSARMELSGRFDHDLRKLCAFLREEETKHPAQLDKPNRTRRSHRPAAAT
ncbi:MAG: hypothetical protein EBS05_18845 [Proteobacteria bacterium]|nr:hypothetical protein [Pseudomonadota bacterium]